MQYGVQILLARQCNTIETSADPNLTCRRNECDYSEINSLVTNEYCTKQTHTQGNDDLLSQALSASIFETNSDISQIPIEDEASILGESHNNVEKSELEIKKYCETISKFYTHQREDMIQGKFDIFYEEKKNQKRENFSTDKTAILKEWLLANIHNPYPDEDAKDWLCFQTNLTLTQINHWLTKLDRDLTMIE